MPDNFDSFEECLFSPVNPIILDDGTELPPGVHHTIRYKVATLLPKTGGVSRYAVKINDMNLFVDLLTVSADQYITIEDHNKKLNEFKEIIAAETFKKIAEATEKIVRDSKAAIKKLAWWKRLFNQF